VCTVFKIQILPILVVVCLVTGCEGMTPTQRGAVTGGALGTGIGMVAGGSFGQVVGAGLIGGAAGAIVGSATSNR
jgi:osmotically inducible lipoprotein OsmB